MTNDAPLAVLRSFQDRVTLMNEPGVALRLPLAAVAEKPSA